MHKISHLIGKQGGFVFTFKILYIYGKMTLHKSTDSHKNTSVCSQDLQESIRQFKKVLPFGILDKFIQSSLNVHKNKFPLMAVCCDLFVNHEIQKYCVYSHGYTYRKKMTIYYSIQSEAHELVHIQSTEQQKWHVFD